MLKLFIYILELDGTHIVVNDDFRQMIPYVKVSDKLPDEDFKSWFYNLESPTKILGKIASVVL